MKCRSLLFGLLSATFAITAIDNPHYWRATNFLPQFYEPRIARNWLTSVDVFAGFGKTHHSRDSLGHTVPLLELYGPEQINTLAIGLPYLDFCNPVDLTLENLALLGCPCNFGQLIYSGHFRITEANFCFSQNLVCGFFLQAHFPYRDMEIRDITVCAPPPPIDESCQFNQCYPNTCTTNNIFWQSFINQYPAFLERFGLVVVDPCTQNCGTRTKGIGDTTLLLGWTYNYEETDSLDYVDFSLRTGILIPTGKKRNPDIIFELPNGYNGHIGVPVSMDFALGYFEWLTIGTHIGGMMFVRKTECDRIHTSPSQNGFIKLFTTEVSEHEGTIWELSGYLKADHVVGGLSFLAGYTFAAQQRNELKPYDKTYFCSQTINEDSTLLGWKMHTVNLYLEYDFTKENRALGPRLGFFYNIQVGGKRIFKTNMEGGFVGFDFAVCF